HGGCSGVEGRERSRPGWTWILWPGGGGRKVTVSSLGISCHTKALKALTSYRGTLGKVCHGLSLPVRPRRSKRSRPSFSSFPNSVWERTSAKLRFAHRVQVPTAWRNRSFAEGRSQTEFGNEATMAATGHFGPR